MKHVGDVYPCVNGQCTCHGWDSGDCTVDHCCFHCMDFRISGSEGPICIHPGDTSFDPDNIDSGCQDWHE